MEKISLTIKDFLYVVTLVVALTVSQVTTGAKAEAAKTQAEANRVQIAANSKITAGYDVIITRLDMIDGSIKELKADIRKDKSE